MDRPIIFSAPMVRALLDGRKTQTRRVLGGRGRCNIFELGVWADSYVMDPGNADWRARDTPYAIGDRLYVRENWRVSPEACEGWHPDEMRGWIDYQAGGSLECVAPSFDAVERATFLKTEEHDWDFIPSRYRPCIHMPRWASRLTLLVEDVRVERLNDLSIEDAIAEGTSCYICGTGAVDGTSEHDCGCFHNRDLAVPSYRYLWDSLHGPDAWDSNPWVGAVTFRVERANIDAQVQP